MKNRRSTQPAKPSAMQAPSTVRVRRFIRPPRRGNTNLPVREMEANSGCGRLVKSRRIDWINPVWPEFLGALLACVMECGARNHHQMWSLLTIGRCAQVAVYDPIGGKSWKNAFDFTKSRFVSGGVCLFW